MDAIGRPKEAQWWYKEGRSVAQIDTQCSQQYVFFTGRPMADHCASILPPWRCLCLPPSSFERPVSDRPPRRLCATVLNMLKTSRRPWRPWRCLNVLCTTIERPRQPFCLLSAFNGDLANFVVAQCRQKGRSPCVKVV